jgi:hypothetical protein
LEIYKELYKIDYVNNIIEKIIYIHKQKEGKKCTGIWISNSTPYRTSRSVDGVCME